jgi:chromosome segregation protein
MQLTQLEIKGFKSFGDKILIHFNEGVTAIVGPNGCGKSNVVDAIRWVLGEQSTRALRSEKMENIIFNGTKTRRPANLAEVSLTFDNTRNILPTTFSQVTITRKLYRTGESEYRINDVQCRLKDITDLFLDTGIGSDSYSIIELKMIEEIIANKEGSRRLLFEEASGISKYKLRKKQTFNRLKDTEEDLARVNDLLFEIEKNLKTLETQAKRAERYLRLKDQYRNLSILLASFRIAGFRAALEKLENEEQAQDDLKLAIVSESDRLEALIQEQKLQALTLEKNLSIQQKAANEAVAKIRTYENEKKIKNERLRFLKEKETRISAELANDKNQLNHAHYNLNRLKEEAVKENETLETLRVALDAGKATLDRLRTEQSAAQSNVDAAFRESQALQENVYKLEKEIAILNIQHDTLRQESTRSVADTESRENELTGFTKVIEETQQKITGLETGIEAEKKQEEELNSHILSTQEQLTAQKNELVAESRKYDARQNEYQLTKSLVDNLEGFPESIRFLKKHTEWAKQAPLLSDVLFCKEEYRVAIENYLEPYMNHYVVDTHEDAIQAIRLLSDSARGRANFFILEAIGIPARSPDEGEGLTPALDIISTDKKYKPLCELLLHNVYIIENEQDNSINENLPRKKIVVLSKSGKFAKTPVSMSGGSVGLFEGKRIGRAKNLESLSKEIRTSELQISRLKISIAELESQFARLKTATRAQHIQQVQQQVNRLHNELVSVKTRQEQYQAFIQSSRDRRNDIEQKILSVTEELAAAAPRLTDLKALKAAKDESLQTLREALQQVSAEAGTLSANYNQQNIRFHQQQNKVAGIGKDREYRLAQEANLNQRIGSETAELEKTQADILDILKDSGDTDEDLVAMYEEKDGLEKAVAEAEQHYYAFRAGITDTEALLSTSRRKKDLAETLTGEIKDRKAQLKLELNGLKERLSVEFSIDIHELIDTEVPADQKEEDLVAQTDRIRKQLNEFGPVNSMAMEAYQEMNERYQFITAQKGDLLDAKASLLETIREIDDKAKEKFMAAFTEAREHFIHVFRSLFNEEDSCDLVLTEPENPLESDIDIIARPKGKRPLSINQLSGGEKTLTATALLFSLYLLKPAPFCIFDEVDAPLDDTNIDKFNNIIRKFSGNSQFIIVSHNKRTIASTDIIYGVTMVEQGISRVVAVDLREVA